MRIEFEADVFSPSGITLLVDGQAQSHVDPVDPTRLFFEYTRRIGHVIDAVRAPGAPIRALHLGGGACTLARYVEATRPGSEQVVVEHDPAIVETVLARLPLPRGADIRVVVADAAEVVSGVRHPGAAYDLVVVDLYTGLEPPAFVATTGFAAGVLDALAPRGLAVVNVADAAGLGRLRTQALAFARARPAAELLVTGDADVVSGAEEGNAVLVVAPDGIPERLEPRLRAHGPHPAEVLAGVRLDFALWGAC
ncbi:SAM-dependent methyltransferase [Agromyces sp. CFH 90414]|uniref:SAM-dependent methyltransferase n=1 Tax=Agromyces agglutinans TaxID=2662258 RepID=A0A6I2F8T1_9MICO|nr:fused MFS/spermidine synthase [Agromyces agglutinans]MRG60187.1 SAM-dependent methyltransferase [Agromyces agglutinans]